MIIIYQPLNKKYRPQNFSNIIYHEEIKQVLINSILNNNIAYATIFYGEHGTGKTTIARIFAKSLNCINLINNYEPCNECQNCQEISSSCHPDVIEIDAASKNNVEAIRELIETTKYFPIKSKYKIYILDEVHMLSNSAFNALLKILEEPPHYIKFCLSTTEYHKIPLTIISRCQRLNLQKINNEEIKTYLRYITNLEKIKIDNSSLDIISTIAKGSLRDALSILDQAAILTKKNIQVETFYSIIGYQENEEELIDLISAILENKIDNTFTIIEKIYKKNTSLNLFFEKLLDLLTELMIYQKTKKLNKKRSLYLMNIDFTKIINIIDNYENKKLDEMWEIFAKAQFFLKNNSYNNALYLLNLTILRACIKINESNNNIKLKKDTQEELKQKIQLEENFQLQVSSKFNHDDLLKILNTNQNKELIEIAINNMYIFNYQQYEIYDYNNLPARYLQFFLKILREYNIKKWRIIYKKNTEEINNNTEKKQDNFITDIIKNNNCEKNKSNVNELDLVKTNFYKLDLFNKLKEKFDISLDNVKIFK